MYALRSESSSLRIWAVFRKKDASEAWPARC
jgi:hypothetical protein